MHYQLISLDIWDTILRRYCAPDEDKLAVAGYIILKYYNYLKKEFKTNFLIDIERKNAEIEIAQENKAKGYDDEYTIEEVFRRLIKVIFIPSFKEKNNEEIVNELVQYELTHEIKVSYPDNKIIEQLKGLEYDYLYYISDFYMSSKQINEILKQVKVSVRFEKGYVSSEYLCNKKSGKLFEIVEEDINILPKGHLHIGDNINADVKIPEGRGMQAIHFRNSDKELLKEKMEQNFLLRKQQKIDCYLSDINVNNVIKKDVKNKEMYTLGIQNSSIFVTFVLEIIEYALKNRIKKVFYCTREGEFFAKIHSRIIEENIWNIELPQAELIEVSRMATFSPSLYDFTVEELTRLWTQYHDQSMIDFYKSLNIKIDKYIKFFERHNINCHHKLSDIKNDIYVRELLEDYEYISLMKEETAQKRELLKEYFRQKGFEEHNKILMVDIGWRGSIQDNIALLYPDKVFVGYYFGIFDSFYEVIPNCKKIGFLSTKNTPEFMWCLNYVDPVEMICNSENGSVTGYKKIEGVVTAIRDNYRLEDQVHYEYIGEFQKGVLASVKLWNDKIKKYSLMSDEIKKYALKNLENIIAYPKKELARAYFKLCHNENFGKGGVESKKIQLKYSLILFEGILKKKKENFWEYIQGTHWPQAFLRVNRLSFLTDDYNYLIRQKWIKIIEEEDVNLSQKLDIPIDSILQSDNIRYFIENVNKKENVLTISGWSIYKGENSSENKIIIALRNEKESLYFKTYQIERKDVTNHFNDGYSYDYSGFKCQIDLTSLGMHENKILIIIYSKNYYFIDTNQII